MSAFYVAGFGDNVAGVDGALQNNYVPILLRFWDIARYWSKIADCNLPYLDLASLLQVTPLEFRRDFWHQKSRFPGLWYSVVRVILRLVFWCNTGL